MLETTIGPKSIRQLEAVLSERDHALLVKIEEESRRHRAMLDGAIAEWSALARPAKPRTAAVPESRLSHDEILASFVELKESQAEVLRRAAASAPSEHLKNLLEEIASREDATAEALKALLPEPE